jgi:Flp pilus assembly protein TadB
VVAGDRDRERAVALLKEHYAEGRLTVDQLSRRVDRVLHARSRWQIGLAFIGLPVVQDATRSAGRSLARGALVVVLTGAWLVFSFTLLVVLGLVLLIHGASTGALFAFLIVWLVPTWLLSRLWRRPRLR